MAGRTERKPSTDMTASQGNVTAMQCRSRSGGTSPRSEKWPEGQERKPSTGITASQGNVKAMHSRSVLRVLLRDRRDGQTDGKGSRPQA